jgi:hypothetical protein
VASLQRSSDCYRQAYAARQDPYPFLNLLAAEIALAWQRRGAAAEVARLLEADLPHIQAALRDTLARERDFWASAMLADLQLLEALAREALSEALLADIVDGYRTAAQRGSPRELASVLDQLDFLIAMAVEQRPAIDRWLRQVRERVARAPQGPEALPAGGRAANAGTTGRARRPAGRGMRSRRNP